MQARILPGSVRRALQRPSTYASAAVVAALLTACGGGGGGGDTASGSTPPTEQPSDGGAGSGGGAPTAPALTLGNDAFDFAPGASTGTRAALDTAVAGGSALFAAWNPGNPQTVLRPGMKVLFFGTATGCPRGTEGPLASVDDAALARVAALTGMAADAATPDLRWTPSARVAGCADSVQGRTGASTVFVNAADNGGVGLYTTSGVQDDGNASFMGPFDSGGQNGAGTNAGITGTFVNFRQPLGQADPVQPWTGGAKARLYSTQNMAAFNVGAGSGETVQVKQQIVATFLNRSCLSELKSSGMPCQVQYLANTGIARSGVSDWSTVSWFREGGLWFDPAQGGIPIIDGPIKPAGSDTLDESTGLSLFSSQGAATQHGTFRALTFDVTISFTQLTHVMRMTTARMLGSGTTPAAVSEAQLAAHWGSGWNDRSQWVLLTADVGQEVYNPGARRRVEVAGGFSRLYVGAQP